LADFTVVGFPKNPHYTLAESCFSVEVLRFSWKSANLRNLWIKMICCLGFGSGDAVWNLRDLPMT